MASSRLYSKARILGYTQAESKLCSPSNSRPCPLSPLSAVSFATTSLAGFSGASCQLALPSRTTSVRFILKLDSTTSHLLTTTSQKGSAGTLGGVLLGG